MRQGPMAVSDSTLLAGCLDCHIQQPVRGICLRAKVSDFSRVWAVAMRHLRRCHTARPGPWRGYRHGTQEYPGVRSGWFLGGLAETTSSRAPRGPTGLNVPTGPGADIQASIRYCPIMYIMSLWLDVDLPLEPVCPEFLQAPSSQNSSTRLPLALPSRHPRP